MRTRRSLLNFITVILFTLVTMVTALFAQRLIQPWLREGPYGAFRTIIDWYALLALLELGLSGAISPLLVRALSEENERALHEVIAAGIRGYIAISLAMVVAGLGVTPFIPWLVKGLGTADIADLRWAWVVGLLSFLPLGLLPLRALVEAEQRGYWINLLLTVQAVFITAVSLLLASWGWGITGQAWALVLGAWTFYATVTGGVLRGRPGLLRAVWSSPTSPELRRSIRNLSAPTILLTISGRISLLLDNTIISRVLDVSLVTSFFFTQRLTTLVQALLQGIGNSTWAALAELHTRQEYETFNRRLVELTRLGSLLAAAGLAPIVAYNRYFFKLWVLDPTVSYGGEAVVLVAAYNAILMPAIALWIWCFTATARVRLIVVPVLISSVVNLSLSIVLTSYFGLLVGPLLGTLLANLGISLWYFPWLLRRVFGTPPLALIRALEYPWAAGALYAIGLDRLAYQFPPQGWFSLVTEMALAALLFLGMAAVIIMRDPANRVLWRSRWDSLRIGFTLPKLAVFRASS